MTGEPRYVPAAGRESLTRFYDLGIRLTMREKTWRPALADAVAVGEPATVVDVGCGTGTLTLAIAARTTAQVFGVDGDPAILALAGEKVGAGGVQWREAYADRLPFDDASVDRVVTSLVLHHLAPETKAAALAEMHRVLRPGGLLFVADWGKPHGPGTRAAFFALQLLDGFANTADHARGLLPRYVADAGFTDVERLDRLRTIAGSFEILRATRP
jgi:ubiquinone/menaquinone biosynthesis C-methylase UbiE